MYKIAQQDVPLYISKTIQSGVLFGSRSHNDTTAKRHKGLQSWRTIAWEQLTLEAIRPPAEIGYLIEGLKVQTVRPRQSGWFNRTLANKSTFYPLLYYTNR